MTTARPGDPTLTLPRAHGPALGPARFRATEMDFAVDEELEVPVHAGGAHWWLRIRKRGMNTKDVAKLLTTLGTAGIRQVGYAGLKDRKAVTSQWFSVPIETLDPDNLADRLPDDVELLDVLRGRHAVRRGGLKANRFSIRLRDIEASRSTVADRLVLLTQGVPNYFGSQRFGIGGGNLANARSLFEGTRNVLPRFERGLYLSAARSQLFNLVAGARVKDSSWNRLIPGEAIILDGSRSWFPWSGEDAALESRLAEMDIHPSGPLHGIGEPAALDVCADLEARELATEPVLRDGIERYRMRAERRSLRLVPGNLTSEWDEKDLLLNFSLPSGTYATVVLRELFDLITDFSEAP